MREGEMRLEIVFERSVICFGCLLPCSELKEVDCDFRPDIICSGSRMGVFQTSDDLLGGRKNEWSPITTVRTFSK